MTTPHPGERPAGYVPAALRPSPTFSRTASVVATVAVLAPIAALIVIIVPTRAALALLVLAAIVTGLARTGL